MTSVLIVTMALASLADANEEMARVRRQMLKERQACGKDTGCQQAALMRGLAKLKAATNRLEQARGAERSAAVGKANQERDRHGGQSGGSDGQYLGLPDWAAVRAALKDRKDCLHRVDWGVLSRRPPNTPGRRRAVSSPPSCGMIQHHLETDRYCQLNRTAVTINMLLHWQDRYFPGDQTSAGNAISSCFGRAKQAFELSDDDGFRLAVLDMIGDIEPNDMVDPGRFVRKALETEPPGRVRDRLEWMER
jgi:hypothetical protein